MGDFVSRNALVASGFLRIGEPDAGALRLINLSKAGECLQAGTK